MAISTTRYMEKVMVTSLVLLPSYILVRRKLSSRATGGGMDVVKVYEFIGYHLHLSNSKKKRRKEKLSQ